MVGVISGIFIRNRERRVIRGSGYDMMTIIMAGCLLGYTGVLTFVADPGKGMYSIEHTYLKKSIQSQEVHYRSP